MSGKPGPIELRNARSSRSGVTDGHIIDLTSRAPLPWQRFSPFYPHGGIPMPFYPDRLAASVEGIWQGLKRFEFEDRIDKRCFENRSMQGLKRTSRAKGQAGRPRGRVLGHQMGCREDILLDYVAARVLIYLPAYRWVLEHHLRVELGQLRDMAERGPLVLLDYSTMDDVTRTDRPLSHAGLVRAWLQQRWPAPELELPPAVRAVIEEEGKKGAAP
jgi:hypothetical protein